MTAIPLLVASLADAIAGLFFVLVGIIVSRKAVHPDSRSAMRMFAVWWYALAGLTMVAGFSNSGGLLGIITSLAGPAQITPPIASLFVLTWLLLSCIALWGLLDYLSFLFRGRSYAVPLGVAYAILFIVFTLIVLQESPQGIVASQFGVRVVLEHPVTGPALVMLLLFLIGPQMGAALAYATIYARVKDSAARYRVALVSMSLLAWIGLSFIAAALRVDTTDGWLVFARVLAIASATTILLAYAPPAFIQRRLYAHPGGRS